MRVLSIILLLLLISCNKKPAVTLEKKASLLLPEDPALFVDGRGVATGKLELMLPSAPTSFLSYAQHTYSNERITEQILLPLLERHPIDDSLRPALAKNWVVSQAGRRLTFELHNDHYWSDGKPITSDDVIFTFANLILNPTSQANYLEIFSHKGQNASIHRIDEKSFYFDLPIPLPAVLATLVYLPILPSHKLSVAQLSPANLGKLWNTSSDAQEIVSSGPFMLSEYKSGKYVKFVRNPYYFRSDPWGTQLPYVEEMSFKIIPSTSMATALFLSKKLDYLSLRSQDYMFLKAHLKKDKPHYRLLAGSPAKSHPSVVHIAFNFDAKDPIKATLFQQQEFRIAMEHLLNRPLIIEQVYKGLARVEGTLITATNTDFYYAPSDTARRSFDPDIAEALLTQLGFENNAQDTDKTFPQKQPFHLRLLVPSGTTTQSERPIAIMFAQQLNESGIETSVETVPQSVFQQRIKEGEFEVAIRSIANSPDPGVRVRVFWEPGQFLYYFHAATYDSYTRRAKPENMLDWEKELVRLYQQAHITSDVAQRKALYDKVQMIYAQQLPVIFTVRQDNLYAHQKTLKNIALNDAGLLVFSPSTVAKSIMTP